MKMNENQECGDCGVLPGQDHKPGCDVAQCSLCGGQAISCPCNDDMEVSFARSDHRLPWSGEWPGVAECREFGWYTNEAGTIEDLNRLYATAEWDREKKRFVLPEKPRT